MNNITTNYDSQTKPKVFNNYFVCQSKLIESAELPPMRYFQNMRSLFFVNASESEILE